MEKRKPMKERMKLFESLDQSSPGSDSASPLTRQSSGESSPSYRSERSSYGEKKKEASLARHKRRQICGESGHSGSPYQTSDCKGPNKLAGGGHKSLMLDQEALTPKNSSRQPLTTQISSVSTASSASHKMIGLESSIPVQVITGEQKLVTSVERSLRVENEQLRERVQDLLHENKVLSELVETTVDTQGDGTLSLGDSGLDSNEDEAVGGAKLVLDRSSMKTDEEGHPVTPSAPIQQQSFTKQVQALKAQLGMRQVEIDTLTNENARKEATITTLTKTVQTKNLEKQRGYHNQDVDVYLEQVSSLTGQLSAMDEQKREDAKKISELERQVSKVSNIARLLRQMHDKSSALKSQVEQLSTALEEEKTLRSSSTSLISSPPTEERIDHRIVNLEAAKVPRLEKQVEELEKQLDESRRFEEMAAKHQDEVFEKVKEVSEKDEEIRKLRVKIQDLEDMNISQLPSRTTSDSLVMNSEAYQILLQESTAKDEQIRQLQPVVEDNERLRMMLEVKAQDLSSKSIEAEQEMAEKDKQISVLGDLIEHKDKLNEQLRERVTQLTVPSLTSGEAGSTGQTDKIQRNAPTSKVNELSLATKRIELQVKRIKELETEIQVKDQGSTKAERVHLARIRELEQQISSMKSRQSDLETTAQVRESKQQTEDVKLGQSSMEKELDQARATIAKLKSDREGFVEHAKKQSKAIADVRAQLEAVQQEKHQLQATLKEHNKDRSVLDSRLRKYSAANAKLQEEVKELEQQEAESLSMAHQMEALQADLDRVRAERNERRQALQELRQVHDHSEQMIITQKNILENQRKAINDFKEITVPKLKDHLQRSQLENQQLARQKDELSSELELVRQQVQVYLDDYNSERKDRESAHSRIAEMETRYTHQLTATADELQTRTKELDAALLVNREVTAGRRQAEAELIQALRDKDRQLQEHAEHTHKLQIDLHSCKKRNEMLFNANQHLKANFQHLQEQYQRLTTANQQLEERLANSNELAPYFIHQPLKLEECRGSGSYGSVYSVQLNGIECIAKRVHDILLGQGREEAVRLEDKCAAYKKFHHECVLLSRMRHPNIVQFLGVQFGPEQEYGRELTLVMEHLYINLEDCIKRYPNMEMWLKLSILLDVLKGLSHLHSEKIIHRDLTATNILLTTNFHAKIADLGVSKIINVHPLMASKQSMIPGTLGYMPPEALGRDPQYHTALDVFSFGVIMLFLIIQEYPQFYEDVLTPTCVQRGEVQIQKRKIWIDKLAPNDSIRQIICHCLQDDPHKRPTIAQLSINLLQLTQQYPKPYSDIMDLLRQQPHQAYYQHGQIRTQSSNPALSPRPLPH